MAAMRIGIGNVGRIRSGKGTGLLHLALVAGIALAGAGGPASAQDRFGADHGAAGGGFSQSDAGRGGRVDTPGDDAGRQDGNGYDTTGVIALDAGIAGRGDDALQGALSSVPEAGADPVTAPDALVVEEIVDDGIVGLIEAPEGAAGPGADAMAPGAVPDALTGPGIATFAETQPQARMRMPGPVGHPPVVVELFTSQGCSSCPPADEMLADLAERGDVLALSWHVDYWDYLGWADEFARPQFTLRQQAYARAWGERAIYTPQMVVGGRDTLIALRPAELMAMLQIQMARPAEVMVTSRPQRDGYRIELTPRAAIAGRVAIILVRYAPSRRAEIRAGENRGVKVEYRNVVLAAERIAEWDGRAPLGMTIRPGMRGDDSFPADTKHAILVQDMDDRGKAANGPILTAIRLD